MNYKKYLRSFFYNFIGLWIIVQLIEGVTLERGVQTLFLSALTLTIVNLLVKPLIKLLFLPINLITMGAFRWLVNVIALYLVTVVTPEFQVRAFDFPGYQYQGFVIPALSLGVFWVLFVSSFFLSLITSLFYWLRK